MPKSIVDLKVEAYDIGKELQELQTRANVLIKKSKELNDEIDKREREKK